MKTRLIPFPYRSVNLDKLSVHFDYLRIKSCYIHTAAKRIIFFMLVAHLLSLHAPAQATHSRWKQNFDVHEFSAERIGIAGPEAYILQLSNMQGITVIDARADTGAIGFMQKKIVDPVLGALNNAAKNQAEQRVNRTPTFLTLDFGLQQEATQFLNRAVVFPNNASLPGILMVIKKLWLSDELNLDNTGTGNDKISWSTGKDQWTSGIDIKIEFFLHTATGYYPLYRYDSVISKTLTVSEYGPEYLALALQLSMQKMARMDNRMAAVTSRRRFSLAEINSHNENAYDMPILKDSVLQTGVYMAFDEFENNRPSQKNFELQKDKQANIIYIKQPDGTEYFAKDAWGYCDGKNIFVRSADNFFLLQRMENAFYIFGAKNIVWDYRGMPGPATYYPSGGGFYGTPSYSGSERELQLKPFQLDWSTGKLY